MKIQNSKTKDPLISMLQAASKDDLIHLIQEIMENDLSVRRVCINYLKDIVTVRKPVSKAAKSSEALTLWYEIEPELSELDEYGGGEYDLEDDVGDL